MKYADFSLIRFGTGLSPYMSGPERPDDLLASLRATAVMERYPSVGTEAASRLAAEYEEGVRAARERRPEGEALEKRTRDALNDAVDRSHRSRLARALEDPTGFTDRLVQFWSSHFSIRMTGPKRRVLTSAYYDDAIRANLTGRFADMLRAVTLHPAMLIYLDQTSSVGPRSRFALRRPKRRPGLNENHARELLELHTVGSGGAYTQSDVRQLAELMTGLMVDRSAAFIYQTNRVEPGAETVLGVEYGGGRPPRLSEIEAFLEDISIHPDTAAHISYKLARHFCADDPPTQLVADLTQRFRETDGDLMVLYDVLVRHREARSSFGQKIRQPQDLITAWLRALGVSGDEVMGWPRNRLHEMVLQPLIRMGQHWQGAPQPEGWPEEGDFWLTPQLLAMRIGWAMRQPGRLRENLPDPREFVATAFGSTADDAVTSAAARAESLSDGVGIVLASPQFNRR